MDAAQTEIENIIQPGRDDPDHAGEGLHTPVAKQLEVSTASLVPEGEQGPPVFPKVIPGFDVTHNDLKAAAGTVGDIITGSNKADDPSNAPTIDSNTIRRLAEERLRKKVA